MCNKRANEESWREMSKSDAEGKDVDERWRRRRSTSEYLAPALSVDELSVSQTPCSAAVLKAIELVRNQRSKVCGITDVCRDCKEPRQE